MASLLFNPNYSFSYYAKPTHPVSLSHHKVRSINTKRNSNIHRNFIVTNDNFITSKPTLIHVTTQKNGLVNAMVQSSEKTKMPIPSSTDGIGIVKFLGGKNYFITGATGFLGKAILEKMLRTVPDVGKIFVLIRAKDKEAAMDRMNKEIVEVDLFNKIKEIQGNSYKEFMMRKVVPIVGDLSIDNLGVNDDVLCEVAQQVDVIINSAASTSWFDRYDVAINLNAKGTSRVLDLAKKCNNLRLFLHISTAYVNAPGEGIIMEQPFWISDGKSHAISLDINTEMNLVSNTIKNSKEDEVTQNLKELGIDRAKSTGLPSNYAVTKFMGEMLVANERENMPLVIFRPSGILSSYKEPFPGWIEGNRVLDPMFISYGKGLLPAFFGDPNIISDLVPIDMVVNATLATIAKHGTVAKPDLNVYHVTSSVENPVTFGEIFDYAYNHFASSPLLDSNGNEIRVTGKLELFKSMDKVISCIENHVPSASSNGRVPKKSNLIVERNIRLAKTYERCMLYKARFGNENTMKLMEEMSLEERELFNFDVGSINWKYFIEEVHIPGLRKHVI